MLRILPVLFFLCSFSLSAQLNTIGSWTDHFPFINGKSIASTGEVIFCAAESGLFALDLSDNAIAKYSKVNFLNDVDLSLIAYSEVFKTLIVTYSNGNIDLIIENDIFNIPFLKLSSTGSEPKEIKVEAGLVYITYDFGIIVLDIAKKEIKETYQFERDQVPITTNTSQVVNNFIYVGTEKGVYKANLNTNLLDFNSWSLQSHFQDNKIKKLFKLNDQLISVVEFITSDSVYNISSPEPEKIAALSGYSYKSISSENQYSSFITESRVLVVNSSGEVENDLEVEPGDYTAGIRKDSLLYLSKRPGPLYELSAKTGNIKRVIKPNGPISNEIFDMAYGGNTLWTVNGGHDFAYNNRNRFGVIQSLNNNDWDFILTF